MFKFKRNTPADCDFPWWHESEKYKGFIHMLDDEPMSFDQFVVAVVRYNEQFPDAPFLRFDEMHKLPLILIRLIECGVCMVVGEAWWDEKPTKSPSKPERTVFSDELGDFN